MCAARRKFRRSGDCFRRKRRLCVKNCKSRVLGNIARMTSCTLNARCRLSGRGIGLLDGFVHRACCHAMHNRGVSFSIMKHDMDHPKLLGGQGAAACTRQVVSVSPARTSRCGTVVTHLGQGRPTSCRMATSRARCFQNSCSLRIHPRCGFSMHLTSAHAGGYRCNGGRGLGACFVSSKYAGVMRANSRCFGVFPM